MKEETIKSAKSSFFINGVWDFGDAQLEAFYKAAYNKAIEDAAKVCSDGTDCGAFYAASIRKLEMK
jgi:hypothetical protein